MESTELFARRMRQEIVKMLASSGSGHPGGSLSTADILAVLYNEALHIDPANPRDPHRDRLVLSKGHAAPALYAALALKGFFPQAELAGLRKLGSPLQGHPDMHKLPGLDFSSGSLGQGLSIAAGMAMAARLDNASFRVYALLGDGEQQEGQIWEAAMFIAHYRLPVIAFLDHNHLQIDGDIEKVLSPEPLDDKWRAFGWTVLAIDGHDIAAIRTALEQARQTAGPVMIIAETVKGKGVSFMENQAGWHGVAPNAEQAAQALKELEG